MQPSNAVHTFLLEADDLLTQVESVALEAARQPSEESVNQLFRAFHTIKGSGAMFGFETVAAFTHQVETALDRVRDHTLTLSPELIDLVLAAKDEIKTLLEIPPDQPAALSESGLRIRAALLALSDHDAPRPAAAKPEVAPEPAACGSEWKIRFRPPANLIACGLDPASLLAELCGLGECRIVADIGAIPRLEEMQPDQCYLAWDITLHTTRGADAIRDVFIFIDGGELAVEAIGEPAPQSAPTPAAQPLPAAARASAPPSTVRVAAEKLDRLVNLVGELVINQSRLTQAATRLNDHDLDIPVEEIERLVDELRDTVLGIRMTPIGVTFNRFKRLVHDLSAELGKEIDLETEGAETELDKTVLDQLGDPLVHLIRNSIDHGLEPAEERLAAGKPPRGVVRLSAAHTGSSVVVRIEDDGRGLDLAAIRAKAVERQLIPADAVLSDKETCGLIFQPGFSTARQVSSVSGRGVGMDIVKRQVEALRGTIGVSTHAGRGTAVELGLPLTLAIIEGLLVAVGDAQYIIPLSAVSENVEIDRETREGKNGRNVVDVRGELVPYIDLRETFEVEGDAPDLEKIVIVSYGDERVGLVVDRVIGSHQTVIQSLGRFYRGVDVVSGATITGDGRVVLILDVANLVTHADRICRTESQRIPGVPERPVVHA